VNLRPGALLGLPPGFPSPTADAALLRDALVLLAVAAGLAFAGGLRRLALALAIAWAALAVGFWTLAMARPYGVLVDAGTTAWAAEMSVAAQAGGDDGVLAGEPAAHPRWAGLPRRAGARVVLLAPSVFAIAVLPLAALLIALVWGRTEAPLAAILWLAAATLEVDLVRGTGLLPVLWARPAAGVALIAALALALAIGRVPARPPTAAVFAIAVTAAIAAFVVSGGARLPLTDAPGVVFLDVVGWVALATFGLRLHRDRAALGLCAGGLTALALSAAGLADAVVASALYRAGLVLAATVAIAAAAERIGGAIRVRLAGRAWTPGAPAWTGLVLAVLLAGAFPTWWDPVALDPVAEASLEPISPAVAETADWIRRSTDPDAVFIAGEDYAPAVAVLGGRRLLRAPAIATAPDEARRVRLERQVLLGRAPEALVRRYGVRYALIAPQQFRAHGLPEPWPAERAFALRYDDKGIRIHEIVPTAARD
jgi:hypothetical protein